MARMKFRQRYLFKILAEKVGICSEDRAMLTASMPDPKVFTFSKDAAIWKRQE
jgi:hypothetical protein